MLADGQVLVAGGYIDHDPTYASDAAELYDPASNTWTTTGDMFGRRVQHTATLLRNGKVLVAGGWAFGFDGKYSLPSAELYDPATGTWANTGLMVSADATIGPIGRFAHTATLMPDGRVLITGGEYEGFFGVGSVFLAELYDPVSGTWKATGRLIEGRELHTATFLCSGEVLIAGGCVWHEPLRDLSSAEIYDPVRLGTWNSISPMAAARHQHTATVLTNGHVLVAGGWHGFGSITYLSSGERYDPASGSWTPVGDMLQRRAQHTATLLPDGRVLAAGGYVYGVDWLASAETYDFPSDNWTISGDLNHKRATHTATLLTNGQVLVTGGSYRFASLMTAELYNSATGEWLETGSLSDPRANHTATLLPNGQVLVAGGMGRSLPLASSELYDAASGIWTVTGSMATTRLGHTATLLANGKVLVAGGTTNVLLGAEIYDPATGVWTPTSPMVTSKRSAHAAALLGGHQVLVVGGNGAAGELASVEVFDSASGSWSLDDFLFTARWSHAAALLPNGSLLVTGGRTSLDPLYLSSAEVYFPSVGEKLPSVHLIGPRKLANGGFQFSFTNATGAVLCVIATTNMALPLSSWIPLGGALEISPGQFQFTDTQATNYAQRFYRTLSP